MSPFEKMSHLKFHKSTWVVEMWEKDSRSLDASQESSNHNACFEYLNFCPYFKKQLKRCELAIQQNKLSLWQNIFSLHWTAWRILASLKLKCRKKFPSEELKKIYLLKIHQAQWVPGLQGGHSECQHVIHLIRLLKTALSHESPASRTAFAS